MNLLFSNVTSHELKTFKLIKKRIIQPKIHATKHNSLIQFNDLIVSIRFSIYQTKFDLVLVQKRFLYIVVILYYIINIQLRFLGF